MIDSSTTAILRFILFLAFFSPFIQLFLFRPLFTFSIIFRHHIWMVCDVKPHRIVTQFEIASKSDLILWNLWTCAGYQIWKTCTPIIFNYDHLEFSGLCDCRVHYKIRIRTYLGFSIFIIHSDCSENMQTLMIVSNATHQRRRSVWMAKHKKSNVERGFTLSSIKVPSYFFV